VEVERLAEAIEGLDACDDAELDDAELHEVAVALGRAGGRLAAAAGKLLARSESCGVRASDQSPTSTARRSRAMNCSTRTAEAMLRQPRRLDTVPTTVPAGSLSPDHIELTPAPSAASQWLQPQLPPQQPPLGEGVAPTAVPTVANIDSTRTVSPWPSGHGVGSATSLIERCSSKRWSQVRQRYS
jgi:hypothetical protein